MQNIHTFIKKTYFSFTKVKEVLIITTYEIEVCINL